MERMKLKKRTDPSISEAFAQYVLYKTARGVKEITVKTYKNHFHSMSAYLDMDKKLAAVTQEDLDLFVVRMRESDLAHNSVCSYIRV